MDHLESCEAVWATCCEHYEGEESIECGASQVRAVVELQESVATPNPKAQSKHVGSVTAR